MSQFGDLSKAQRALLAALFSGIRGKSAVSIDTAVRVDGKGRQTARNLAVRGLVEFDSTRWWTVPVWLTPAGLDLMRSLDFRHSRARNLR